MAFNYDLATLVGKLRLRCGDHTENVGLRPDNGNFSDEELTQILTDEDDDIDRSFARVCEILASEWARVADVTLGPRSEKFSQISKRYQTMATSLRQQYGGGGYSFTVGWEREDGWQEEADALTELS